MFSTDLEFAGSIDLECRFLKCALAGHSYTLSQKCTLKTYDERFQPLLKVIETHGKGRGKGKKTRKTTMKRKRKKR